MLLRNHAYTGTEKLKKEIQQMLIKKIKIINIFLSCNF